MLLDNQLDIHYQSELFQSYYKGKGKSISIQPFFSLLVELLNKKKVVSIIDIGCGIGSFLSFVKSTFSKEFLEGRLLLSGLDYDEELISTAQRKLGNDVSLHVVDLTNENWSRALVQQYDLVITTNTFHEVFSDHLTKQKSFEDANFLTKTSISQLLKITSMDGYLIFYDGVLPPQKEKKVKVKITQQNLDIVFKIAEEKGILIETSNNKDLLVELTIDDLLQLLLLIKFWDTALWDIERKQKYQYATKAEFVALFQENGSELLSIAEVTSDIDIWQKSIQICSDDFWYPPKSILLVVKK